MMKRVCQRASCVALTRGCDCPVVDDGKAPWREEQYAAIQRARLNGVTCQNDQPSDCTFPRCSCGDIREEPARRDYIGIIVAVLTVTAIFCVMLYASTHGYIPRAR